VSPFGARGGNGGVQDADNLAWKLAAVLQGSAPAALIRTYDDERIPAADENILHSTRATDFITPKTEAARAYRDAVLTLAGSHGFARAMVNSGRLSRPYQAASSPLNAPDSDAWEAGLKPGSPAVDAPVEKRWLLHELKDFTLVRFEKPSPTGRGLGEGRSGGPHPHPNPLPEGEGGMWREVLLTCEGLAAQRYAAFPGASILFRPDQHIAALFRAYDPARIQAAINHVLMRPHPLERVA
jgi:3-(3-hydroxy-phenyl)propionate hydroxylase